MFTWSEPIHIEKRVTIQPNPPLERSPCSEEKYSTCIENLLHKTLGEQYHCKASILNSGIAFLQNKNKSLTECSNNITSEVS